MLKPVIKPDAFLRIPEIILTHISTVEEPTFLRRAREFLFSSMFARESSKRVPTFDRGTGTKVGYS